MEQQYVAWNGQAYRWPPPAGWQQAMDGRWWPTATPAPPPPPPPPAPVAPAPARGRAGRGLPWPVWLVLIVVFVVVGLPLLAAFLRGFATGFAG